MKQINVAINPKIWPISDVVSQMFLFTTVVDNFVLYWSEYFVSEGSGGWLGVNTCYLREFIKQMLAKTS